MEVGSARETVRNIPQKELPPEVIQNTSLQLLTTIHKLFNLQKPENDQVCFSKKRAYQWCLNPRSVRENYDPQKDPNLEITEDTMKKAFRRKITLRPDLIAVTYLDLKSGKHGEYVNTEKALAEIRIVMSHLSANAKTGI
jgi:hypothetical protein